MKAIQTVWTAGKLLKEDSFGWVTPQANLMSWALSSYCLSDNFSEVELYTDSEGARVLVDELKLPYTEVHVCYDDLRCHPTHWAYAKIKTYSMQNSPFVHIDGDMYLPSGLPITMNRYGVITQNKEKGSEYYKGMMNRIITRSVVLPDFLSAEVRKKHIGSYNMGLVGGCDLSFIHRYCEEAFKIVIDNGWDSPNCATPDMNNNLLFEQVLLYAFAKKCGEKVGTVIKETLGDNKYTYEKTCDMMWFDKRTLFHLLGGHKRNKYACAMMERMLLRKFPKAYVKVLSLFEKANPRCTTPRPGIFKLNFSRYMGIYQRAVNGWIADWNTLDCATICEMERHACNFMDFLISTHLEKKRFFDLQTSVSWCV